MPKLQAITKRVDDIFSGGFPTHDPNIILKQKDNPLSAVDKWDDRPVVKFSFLPPNKVLYSMPGNHHSDAINKANDTKNFDNYVRIIYDPAHKVAGSRVWGRANYENEDPEADTKSFDAQFLAYEFFKRKNPKLRWVFNLSGQDLQYGSEHLDTTKMAKSRILKESQLYELKAKNEALRKSLSRVAKHLGLLNGKLKQEEWRQGGIVSAFRSGTPSETNLSNHKALGNLIQQKYKGIMALKGYYQEEGSDKPTEELSWLVPNANREDMNQYAKVNNQDSFIWGGYTPDKQRFMPPAIYDTKTGEVLQTTYFYPGPFSKMSANPDKEFWSELPTKKKFALKKEKKGK
jgi:hypothetical protein